MQSSIQRVRPATLQAPGAGRGRAEPGGNSGSRSDFCASTGVTLERYEATARAIQIEIGEGPRRNAPRHRAYFIGKDGAVLKRDDSPKPSYRFQGSELYVRARIEDSNGARAWTQPVFLKR